jgi:membrane protein implicated in regulation of membrane protease activity
MPDKLIFGYNKPKKPSEPIKNYINSPKKLLVAKILSASSLLATSFLLLATSLAQLNASFLLLATSFLLLSASFLLLSASFLLLSTSFALLSTSFALLATSFALMYNLKAETGHALSLRKAQARGIEAEPPASAERASG